jgi:hypothetical protein
MDTKFNAALEQTVQQVHNSILASTQSTTTAMKEMEAKVVKQITHITAKVLACENTVNSHEQRFAAMDESISEVIRGTEDKLRELRIRGRLAWTWMAKPRPLLASLLTEILLSRLQESTASNLM